MKLKCTSSFKKMKQKKLNSYVQVHACFPEFLLHALVHVSYALVHDNYVQVQISVYPQMHRFKELCTGSKTILENMYRCKTVMSLLQKYLYSKGS
jgi:hypothetical protein